MRFTLSFLLILAFTDVFGQRTITATRQRFDSTAQAWGDTDRVVTWLLQNEMPVYREELQQNANQTDRYVYTNWQPLHPKSMSNATFDYDDFVDWTARVGGYSSTRDTLSGWFIDRWVPRTVVARTLEGEFLTEVTVDQDPAGGGFSTVSRIMFSYDGQDNLESWELWNLHDQQLRLDVKEINEIRYNSSDQIVSIRRYGYYDGTLMEDDSQVYSYDLAGRINDITLYPAGGNHPTRLLRGVAWHEPYRAYRYNRALPIFNGDNGYTEYFIDRRDTTTNEWLPYIQVRQLFEGTLPVRYERRLYSEGEYRLVDYDSLSYYPNGDPKGLFEYRSDSDSISLYSAMTFDNTYTSGRLSRSDQREFAQGLGWVDTYRYTFNYLLGDVNSLQQRDVRMEPVGERVFRLTRSSNTSTAVRVVSLLGQEVVAHAVDQSVVTLDLSDLSVGVYYVMIDGERLKVLLQ